MITEQHVLPKIDMISIAQNPYKVNTFIIFVIYIN